MTAKEYLSQIRKSDNQINNKLAEISRLREMATSITSTLKDDVVQTSGSGDKLGEVVSKIVDLENEINADVDKLVDTKKEIMSVIDTLKEPFCDLLYKRYLHYMTWEEIAVAMNYSFRHVTRMHGTALQMVKRVLECPIEPGVKCKM